MATDAVTIKFSMFQTHAPSESRFLSWYLTLRVFQVVFLKEVR